MIKKWFGFSFILAGLFVTSLWLSQGCTGKIPPLANLVLTSTPTLAPNVVSNFENGSTSVNPGLTGSYNGYWSDATYGGPPAAPNTINSTFVVSNTVSDSTDSSSYAVHIGFPSGPVTLITTGIGNGYESDQLTCHLVNSGTNPYYDATPFRGIAFYYNFPSTDTNSNRAFQIATMNTVSAYNHFQVLMTNGSSSGWKPVTYMWPQFVCPFGSCNGAMTTTGASGNLNHIAFLQWQLSDNVKGQAVTLPGTLSPNPGASASTTFIYAGAPPVTVVYNPLTYTDFWVDNVQFVP